MNNYEVTVSHKWNMIVEAESEEDAKAQALALDEEIPCDDMGTDVEVVGLPRVTVLNESAFTDLDGMTQGDGFHALCGLEHKFGWFSMCMTRGDVESLLESEDIELTDAMWEEVRNSYEWRKGMNDALVPTAYEIMGMMLDDLPSVIEARKDA